MKGIAKGRKRGVLRKWEKRKTDIDEHKGGKEWKEELDGTLAASACSQEDYSSTRCHRLPARPQRGSMNGDTHTRTYISVDVWLFHLFPLLFNLDLQSFSLLFSLIHLLFPACSPASLFLLWLSVFITFSSCYLSSFTLCWIIVFSSFKYITLLKYSITI